MPNLRAVVTLGRISHETTVKALGAKRADAAFGHGKQARLGKLTVFASYHCSRYNTNTGVLTPAMFKLVFKQVRDFLTS